MTNDKKYTVEWAEEKRKTCKLCLRKKGYGFCKRHSPKVIIEKVKYRRVS